MSLYTQTIVISIDYRLSPAYKYPVPINDGIDAFEYIARHLFDILDVSSSSEPASPIRNRINTPVKLILSGTSSGGHLAAIVSQHAREWLAGEENRGVAERVNIVGVLLRAPVTVDAGDEELIPLRWRGVHTSWWEGYEGAGGDRQSMRVNHGEPIASFLKRFIGKCFLGCTGLAEYYLDSAHETEQREHYANYTSYHQTPSPCQHSSNHRLVPTHSGAQLAVYPGHTSRSASWISSATTRYAIRRD
jgi:acetyl esterase/lipase